MSHVKTISQTEAPIAELTPQQVEDNLVSFPASSPIVSDGVTRKNIKTLWKVVLIGCPLSFLLSFCIYHFFRYSHNAFLKEDGMVETLTAICFLLGGLVGIYNLARTRRVADALLYLCIPVLGILGFLDEISWGERFSKKSAPVFIQDGVKIDGVHDGIIVFERWVRNSILPYSEYLARNNFIIMLVGSWLACTLIAYLMRKRFPALLFLSPAMFFVYVGIYLDCREKIRIWVGPYQLRIVVEELNDLNGAFCVLAAAITIGIARKSYFPKSEADAQIELTAAQQIPGNFAR